MKLWSALTKRTQAKYRKDGVTPQRYNAWNRSSKATKERLAKQGVDRQSFLKASNTREAQLTSFRQRAITRLLSILPRVNATTVREHVPLMTPAQLQIALRGKVDRIRHLASIQRDYLGVEFQYNPKDREKINPFWYH